MPMTLAVDGREIIRAGLWAVPTLTYRLVPFHMGDQSL
jgi:hypothetical protein